MQGKLYTIGHSVQSQEDFFKKLKDKGVTVLVDVRSVPYSKFAPQFNRLALEKAAAEAGIQYRHEPEAFGARRTEKDLYNKEGYVDFNKVRSTVAFRSKVSEYSTAISNGENVALMCTEKDPLDCHRAILVARGFSLRGVQAGHILADGSVMTQEELDKKLVRQHFPAEDQPSLFSEYPAEDNKTLTARAYDKQNAKVGYKMSSLQNTQARDEAPVKWEGVNENGELLSTKDRVAKFRGEYGFLSNMYDCPVEYKGATYHSSEAAYQAQRPVRQEDRDKFTALSGVEAKKLVDKLEGRKDWHEVNTSIMAEIVEAKFRQNKRLADRLLATGDKQLVEGNRWHDTYWGVCNGRGKNMLGKILMDVRDRLRKERELTGEKVTDGKAAVAAQAKEMSPATGKDEYVIAVTGHRPHLMFGYDWKNDGNKALSSRIENVLKQAVAEAEQKGYKKFRFVTGMALGADQMFAANAIRLASAPQYKGRVTVEAAVPFKGQEKQWPASSQKTYNVLLAQCDTVTIVSPGGYSAKAMQDRNEYMADKADVLLSVYDGKSVGGTKNCLDYARAKGVKVVDVGLPELLDKYPQCRGGKKTSLKPRQNYNADELKR